MAALMEALINLDALANLSWTVAGFFKDTVRGYRDCDGTVKTIEKELRLFHGSIEFVLQTIKPEDEHYLKPVACEAMLTLDQLSEKLEAIYYRSQRRFGQTKQYIKIVRNDSDITSLLKDLRHHRSELNFRTSQIMYRAQLSRVELQRLIYETVQTALMEMIQRYNPETAAKNQIQAQTLQHHDQPSPQKTLQMSSTTKMVELLPYSSDTAGQPIPASWFQTSSNSTVLATVTSGKPGTRNEIGTFRASGTITELLSPSDDQGSPTKSFPTQKALSLDESQPLVENLKCNGVVYERWGFYKCSDCKLEATNASEWVSSHSRRIG